MQRIKKGDSTTLEAKEPLTKSSFNEPGLQGKIDEIDTIVIPLKNNRVEDGPTNFEEEAARLKRILVVLPRGTLAALKNIL